MENFKLVVSASLALVGILCGLVSFGFALFTKEISPTFVGVYLLVLVILLGLQHLVKTKVTRKTLSKGLIFYLLTLTALQLPWSVSIAESLPLWMAVVLIGALTLYAFNARFLWERNQHYGREVNAFFIIIVITPAYFSSVVTLIDGAWNTCADLAAISIISIECFNMLPPLKD